MEELISVIVPIYNVELYLESCIKSIIGQSYKCLEIILIDDGSKDNSGKMCDEYAMQDSRIIVIHKENGGLSSARNAGLDIATGEYIVFIDSDDMMHPCMIEILYRNISKYGADIAICSYKEVDDNKKSSEIKEICANNSREKMYTGRECVEELYAAKLGIDMVVVWNKLYKSQLFKKLRFPEGKIHEDEYVNYQIMYPLEKCIYTNLKLYYYRQRLNSITNRKKFNLQSIDKIEMYKQRLSFFEARADKELYNITLIKFQANLSWIILEMRDSYPDSRTLIRELEDLYKKNYAQYIINNKDIAVFEKVKGIIFIMCKNLYKILRRYDTERYKETMSK